MKANRNDPCICGSGKKYKHCCGPKASHVSGKTQMLMLLGALVIAGSIVVGKVYYSNDASPADAMPAPVPAPAPAPNAAGGPGTPQPPGPAPAGKVWSAEHGHWHDAPGAQPSGASQTPAAQPQGQAGTPQPPGPAPEGKVWSAEHGHWHDK